MAPIGRTEDRTRELVFCESVHNRLDLRRYRDDTVLSGVCFCTANKCTFFSIIVDGVQCKKLRWTES